MYGEQINHDTARPVTVTNLGVGGWTSQDLLASLSADDSAAATVHDADLITVTIGANDFFPALDTYLGGRCGGDDHLACFAPIMHTLRSNLSAILRRLYELRAGQRTAVRVTGYWDVFIDGHVAEVTYGSTFLSDSSALTRQVNNLIRAVAQEQGATYVDLFARFKGSAGDGDPTPLLADDGDHPNQAGHQEIADSLALTGYAPLATVR